MCISQYYLSLASVLILNRVVKAGAQALLEYLTTKPHNYTVCQQVKDMLEVRCHMDRTELKPFKLGFYSTFNESNK